MAVPGCKRPSRHLSNSFGILSLNIEGISKDKSDYVSKLAHEQRVEVVLLQETHTESEESLRDRGNLKGYVLVDFLLSKIYGLACYVKKSSACNVEFIQKGEFEGVFFIAFKFCDISVTNIYKPPNNIWPRNFNINVSHPSIYCGDFNSHHTMWGYNVNDRNGIAVTDWMEDNDHFLIFDAKDKPTFHSSRWNRGYNPDLCIVSCGVSSEPLSVKRKILGDFPRSQHRPMLITFGDMVNFSSCLFKSRWNFKKANWVNFANQVDADIRWFRPSFNNYSRFVGVVKAAAKKFIPRGFRKEYIPGWSKETENLYNVYQNSPSIENSENLMNSINTSRKEKWNSVVSNMNFTHSSRSSWDVLRKLGEAAPLGLPVSKIDPELIARRLVGVSNSVEISSSRMKDIKNKLNKFRTSTTTDENISYPFHIDELKSAIKFTKSRKAAGFDGIYPEFIKHLGKRALSWLLSFYNNILSSGNFPKEFRKAKVISILKRGKNPSDPSSYRPISLLSVPFKILERLIMFRIESTIEEVLQNCQGGFRKTRNCCDQVLSLTTFIESGFNNKLKTGAAFVDLSAAYDTVWKDGLILKLYSHLKCGKMVRLIENMLTDRRLRVFVDNSSSKFKTLNNGLPQGSVLAPILFNLYLSDIPNTSSEKFIYADDIALAFPHSDFEIIEKTLSTDLKILKNYFHEWRLCPSPIKTEVSCFHLNNQQKFRELKVTFDNTFLKHNFNPKYLGVKLDSSLNFKAHLEDLSLKLKTRNNILQKLAGTSWGADAPTLRTAALALVFSAAEYCCPVWLNSTHVSKVDAQLNLSMRIITGTIRSSPTQWLPVLSNITPPHIRRQTAAYNSWHKFHSLPNSFPILSYFPETKIPRLKSRKPFWSHCFSNLIKNDKEIWRTEWNACIITNKDLIKDPANRVPGFDLPRKIWSVLNRIRTGHGRCNSMLFKWNSVDSPNCECGEVEETIDHLVTRCPIYKFQDGMTAVHNVSESFLKWVSTFKTI